MSKTLDDLTNKQVNEFFNLEKEEKKEQIIQDEKHRAERQPYNGKPPAELVHRQAKEAQQLKSQYKARRDALVKLHIQQREFAEKQEKLKKAITEAQREEERLAKEARDKKVQEFLDQKKSKGKDLDRER